MNPEMILVAQSVGETFQQTVASGPILLALGACVLAGLVSFASPCVIPLVPGYVAYLASVVGAERPPVTVAAAERQRAATSTMTLEERRTRAVQQRRYIDPQQADDLGRLDAAAIAMVREEAWPEVRNADEMHDALTLRKLDNG